MDLKDENNLIDSFSMTLKNEAIHFYGIAKKSDRQPKNNMLAQKYHQLVGKLLTISKTALREDMSAP